MTDEKHATGVKEVASDKPRVPADIPTFYADQVLDIVYGIWTSKIVLGAEDGSASGVRPVATVVIPTPSLMMACIRIATDVTKSGMIDEASVRYEFALNAMRELGGFLTQDSPQKGGATPPPEKSQDTK